MCVSVQVEVSHSGIVPLLNVKYQIDRALFLLVGPNTLFRAQKIKKELYASAAQVIAATPCRSRTTKVRSISTTPKSFPQTVNPSQKKLARFPSSAETETETETASSSLLRRRDLWSVCLLVLLVFSLLR